MTSLTEQVAQLKKYIGESEGARSAELWKQQVQALTAQNQVCARQRNPKPSSDQLRLALRVCSRRVGLLRERRERCSGFDPGHLVCLLQLLSQEKEKLEKSVELMNIRLNSQNSILTVQEQVLLKVSEKFISKHA